MKSKIKTAKFNKDGYPSLLKEIPCSPLQINILGKLPGEEKPRVAIVGTRKATAEGLMLARKISRQLSELGAVIVSGLAMGIDTAAHEGALDGKSETIAVLACGLHAIYPRQNENLAKRIIEAGGAIVSEYPIGTPALPNQFLERNRIVSGLSLATIVIEAPISSGALVTARLAAEQGREVFVFPGPINHPNYRGSHKLIRDGARLVVSVEDILEDLPAETFPKNSTESKQQKLILEKIIDKNQSLILKIIQEAGRPINIDKITELTKLEPKVISQNIAVLVINEIIKETEKGYAI
ncbi:DNA-protecting protein DprA [Candidatus Wolfebacteria bacterium]|nr:DNA-protecting protein DprA [Candidatus Wolfebacteria bacterium]